MNEKDLLQKINDDAKDVTPPASLSPEAVEQMLLRRKGQDTADKTPFAEPPVQNNDRTRQSPAGEDLNNGTAQKADTIDSAAEKVTPFTTGKKKKSRRNILRFGSVAAVFAVAFTVFWQYQHGFLNSDLKSESFYSELPDAEKLADTKLSASMENVKSSTDETAADEENTDTSIAAAPKYNAAAENNSVSNNDITQEANTASDSDISRESSAASDNNISAENSAAPESNISSENSAAPDSDIPTENSTASDSVISPENTADDAAEIAEDSADNTIESSEYSAASQSALADSGNSAEAADSGSADAGSSTANAVISEDSASSEQFTYAGSYEEIYQALYDRFSSDYDSDMVMYGAESLDRATADGIMAITEDSAADTGVNTSAAEGFTDFSQTNIQEQGVDEADIIKTDGDYIYILRQNLSLAIVKADGKDSAAVSITDFSSGNDSYIQEMYLDGDMLNIILTEYVTSLDNDSDIYYTNSSVQTRVITYDISDRSQPVQTGSIYQEGSYLDSRKNGSYLYLFTSYYPNICDTYDESTIVPRINGADAAADDFYLPETLESSNYLIISSMNTAAPEEICDSKILVSGASNFYVSTENIYIANQQYNTSPVRTEITKFHYADGEITGVAAGSVKGYLNNSFSMNEYQGNLRVVTTYYGDEYNAARDLISSFTGEYYEENWTEHNALYVLNDALQQIGAIEDLAEGEIIRSARFFGDIGYFVTFRQTDPLFSVDLSDPENPQILGELKVSGFSSYLHFYGENLLLGIGYEADESTGTVSGLKLSMFDISDPSNVTEVNRFVLPGITWCPAIEDYKSILVQPEKNLIGFYCDNRYMVFSYDHENGFTQNLLYDFYSDMLGGEAEYDTMRGLYIGDDFYLAGNTFLISFDMNNSFVKEGLLKIE